jgi:hypothetical protein
MAEDRTFCNDTIMHGMPLCPLLQNTQIDCIYFYWYDAILRLLMIQLLALCFSLQYATVAATVTSRCGSGS